jgi:GNAT superfamily N-acetyltransferase
MKVQIQIDGEWGNVKSDQGQVEFAIDNDGISIFQIFVSRKRCGIGSALIKRLEDFCLQRNIRRIAVPSTPSKEALLFWLAKGYNYVFSEDRDIGHMMLSSQDPEKIEETESGIILLEKSIGGHHEKPR